MAILLNYHIGRIDFGSMCVGVSVWFGWSGIRVVGHVEHIRSEIKYKVTSSWSFILQPIHFLFH